MTAFYVSRHLYVGDVIFSDAGATIIVKWSKITQDRVSSTIFYIPFKVSLPYVQLMP